MTTGETSSIFLTSAPSYFVYLSATCQVLANIENIRKNHISLSVKLLWLSRLILAHFTYGFSRYKPHFGRKRIRLTAKSHVNKRRKAWSLPSQCNAFFSNRTFFLFGKRWMQRNCLFIFSISAFCRRVFIVIFADKAKNEKDLQAPHIGNAMKLVRGSKPPA